MSEEAVMTAVPAAELEPAVDNEFGLGINIYLIARLVYSIISLFAVLGAAVCFFVGLAVIEELISLSCHVSQSTLHANDAEMFVPYLICMICQVAYAILSPISITLVMLKKNKLFAFIDLGIFVVLFLLAMILSGGALLFNGSYWIFLLFLNPVWLFVALLSGKHFKHMPTV